MSNPFPSVSTYFLLGKTLKSHGTGGQLRLLVERKFKPYLNPGNFLFFDHDGSKVPFKILTIEEDAHLVISLESVDSKQKSDLLANQDFWIPTTLIKPQHLNAPRQLQDDWADYFILDQSSKQMYPMLRTEEFPQQLMGVIELEGKEVFIPLHEDLISAIDKKERIIYMEIPEGLLEL